MWDVRCYIDSRSHIPQTLITIEITNQVRIQPHSDYWFTVEDTHLDAGGEGFTISYWENERGQEKRVSYICLPKEEAFAVADAIQKLAP